jgi:hypothetical protein
MRGFLFLHFAQSKEGTKFRVAGSRETEMKNILSQKARKKQKGNA